VNEVGTSMFPVVYGKYDKADILRTKLGEKGRNFDFFFFLVVVSSWSEIYIDIQCMYIQIYFK